MRELDGWRAGPRRPGEVQGSLFGGEVPEPDGVGDLEEPAKPRGRGRPPGSRNRSTDDWSKFLLTRYRSPLVGLAEIAQASPLELQRELGGSPSKENPDGCTLVEALRIIMQAQAALAPYVHQKMPTAIDGGGVAMMQVIVNAGTGSEAAETLEIRPVQETEEYQQLSESDRATLENEGRNE
ncbi:hypothetical protein [Roseivivax marinus]|uniref:hypothetical protein n=1 Tax=Roseivivax marinus TaxID=1379903 RepID=UPI00103AED0A|nr:hypothetical protein [Roseivivax marinus]